MIFYILLTLIVLIVSGITTVPLLVGLLAAQAVLFKKSWVFFWAFGIGLFLDLIMIRQLGYTALIFSVFVLLIRLYEKKFETKTAVFVFISTFLGSLFYLWLFGYQNIFLQSLVCSVISIFLLKFLISNFKFKMNSEILND